MAGSGEEAHSSGWEVTLPLDGQGRKLGPGPAQKPSQEGARAPPGAMGWGAAVADCLDTIKLAMTSWGKVPKFMGSKCSSCLERQGQQHVAGQVLDGFWSLLIGKGW